MRIPINKRILKLVYCFNTKGVKRAYSTNKNIRGDIKHYTPANKEWKNSVYSYDKNYLKSLPVNNNTSNKIITAHFYLTNLKNIARSKRMRDIIIKRSSRKVFVSKPSIKHNNDKIIVNIYTFNRQKEFLMRKLFFYKKKYNLFKQWLNSSMTKKIRVNKNTKVNKNTLKKTLKKKLLAIVNKRRKQLKIKRIKRIFSFYGIKYKNELDYLKYRTLNISRKLLHFNNMFMFIFLKKLLYLFNINLFIPILEGKKKNRKRGLTKIMKKRVNKLNTRKKTRVIKYSTKVNTLLSRISKFNRNIFVKKTLIREIMLNKSETVMWLDKNFNLLNLTNKYHIDESTIKNIMFKSRYTYSDIVMINKRILSHIENKLIKTGMINESDLISLFIKFKAKYFNRFIFRFFKKRYNILHYLNGLELNNLKFTKLLHNLRVFISRIYNKKVELNITNLKYPFLNSDIYTKVTINKAAKNLKILKVLSSSLSLSKIPKEIFYAKRDNLKLNNFKSLNEHKNLLLNSLNLSPYYSEDTLSNALSTIYPNDLVNKKQAINNKGKYTLGKINDVLNTIKFKWVTGAWLQAAGRLTRRASASRSMLKFKHKGSLKNKQYHIEDYTSKPMSTVMIRNTEKSNSQYTYLNSKKHVGTFGIKSWISSY